MTSPTLDEVRTAKAALEKSVTELITNFERDHAGVIVRSIEIEHYDTATVGGSGSMLGPVSVNLDLKV